MSRLTPGSWVDSETTDEKQPKEVQAWWGKIVASDLDAIDLCTCATFKWRCQVDIQMVLRLGVCVDCGVRGL